ncbi:MAG: hypothetical protein WC595_02615 [Candidatus Nanoarchaeia archaeon]
MARTYYQVKNEGRTKKIKTILSRLSPVNSNLEPRLEQLAINYQGRDGDALSVLVLATRVGRFEEYLHSLEEAYTKSFSRIHPADRKKDDLYGHRLQDFFIECYATLGIVKPKRWDITQQEKNKLWIREQLDRLYEQTQPTSRSA